MANMVSNFNWSLLIPILFVYLSVHVHLCVCIGGRARATEHREIRGLARVSSLFNTWALIIEVKYPYLLSHHTGPFIQSSTGSFTLHLVLLG